MDWSVRVEPRGPAWTVRHRASFHEALVLEVDAQRIDDARRIAAALLPAEQRTFEEILIYVHRGNAVRRIQWTRRDGITETVISP